MRMLHITFAYVNTCRSRYNYIYKNKRKYRDAYFENNIVIH